MKILTTAVCFALLLLLVFSGAAFSQKLKAEDVVVKHLDSIGTAQTRSSIKNQIAVGEVYVTFVTPKNRPTQGRIVMVSEGVKNFMGMNLTAIDYPQERFLYDGKTAKVSMVINNIRSVLGNFLMSNNSLLEESLLGGTLSTSWALANLATNKAKVSFDGTKKIDGKETYVIGYSPKGGGDLDIKLYFDKETFQHVRSEYKRVSSAGIGTRPEQSSGFNETRIKLTEDFSDFKAEKGVTMPHAYRLFYSISGQNGTSEVEWKFNLTEFAFNQTLDAKTFDAAAN